MQALTVAEFVERFERPRLPVVITGLCNGWKGRVSWTEEGLLGRYGEHKFKVIFNTHPVISDEQKASKSPLQQLNLHHADKAVQMQGNWVSLVDMICMHLRMKARTG